MIKRVFMAVIATLAFVAVPAGSATVSAWGNEGHQSQKYVALGDSVAAGLGLPPNPQGTNEDKICGRSPQAYSSIVASTLSLDATNVACQGAVVKNLSESQTIGSTSIQPQLNAAFAGGTPKLITLTIGANDVRWADFIRACFVTTCDTEANTKAADAYLASLESNLKMGLIYTWARGFWQTPPVVVTGYYQSVSDKCASSSLTPSEIAWFRLQTDKFNTTLQKATKDFYFAKFAPVDFTGHDICSPDPWIQRPGVPGEPAPFHPNVKGQEAMAKAVVKTLGH
jgi:lysophospholipase L1-like esterase